MSLFSGTYLARPVWHLAAIASGQDWKSECGVHCHHLWFCGFKMFQDRITQLQSPRDRLRAWSRHDFVVQVPGRVCVLILNPRLHNSTKTTTSLTASKLSHRTSYLAMPIKPNSNLDQVVCSGQYLLYNITDSQTHAIFSKAQVTNGAHSNEARPASSWYQRRPPMFFGGSHLASFWIVQVMLVPAINLRQKKKPPANNCHRRAGATPSSGSMNCAPAL